MSDNENPTIEVEVPTIEVDPSQSEQTDPATEDQSGAITVSNIKYGDGLSLEKERKMMWSVDMSLLPNIRPFIKN